MPKFHLLDSMRFFASTCLHRKDIRSYKRPDVAAGDSHKSYPDVDTVSLPKDWSLQEARITPLLQQRRSRRTFGTKPVSLSNLAYMAWATQGVTAQAGKHLLRTSPSAGALYPIETYIAVNNVEDLVQGIYHLNVAQFSLELVVPGDYSEDLSMACLNQQFLGDAAAVFIWRAVFRRSIAKYGDRGLRYVFMDSAHICQNLLLAAEATGNNCCPVAAFFDEEINELLDLDGGEESAIYLAGVGTRPK